MTTDNNEFGPVVLFEPKQLPVKYRLFFEPATGRINGYEYSTAPSVRDGQDYLDLDREVEFHKLGPYKVDPATRIIVAMTDDEIFEAQLQAEHEVKAAIFRELESTDSLFVPGRPLKDAIAWLKYRQALRDLSKQGLDHLDQLRAWPARPDEQDPIPQLRARVTKRN